MKQLWLTAKLDIVESLRARWFQIYTLVFGGIVALLFLFGLTESRVLGFIGLSRLLVTYIQLTMAILPIFVLITTVRSVAGDREAGVFEYLLSLPVAGGVLYVEPVYVRATGAEGFPLLQKVLVGFGNKVAMKDTLQEALTTEWSRERIRQYAESNSWDERVGRLCANFAALGAPGSTASERRT